MKVTEINIIDCLMITVLLLFLTVWRIQASEASAVLQQKQDSLLHVLSKLNNANEKSKFYKNWLY